MRAKVIVNPHAARGALRRHWPEIEAVLRAEEFPFDTVFTEGRGHGAELARQALAAGYDCLVAAGGDGAIHEVVNGMYAEGQPVNPAASLGIITAGTGADFVRTAGIPRGTLASARHLARTSRTRPIDAGEIVCCRQGRPVRSYMINVAGLGFAAAVVERTERRGKQGRGTIPYLAALVHTIFRYRNQPVSLEVDGQTWRGLLNSLVICNGQYFGGGMKVGPEASVEDGQFDLIVVEAFAPLEFLWHTPKLYRGTHTSLKQVRVLRGQSIKVEGAVRLPIQADGELIGECPATISVLPKSLLLRG